MNIAQLRTRERELRALDAELAQTSAEATAGGGLVKVRVDGHRGLKSLVIDPAAFALRDADLLADLIVSAVTEAQRRIDERAVESLHPARNPESASG